METSPARTTSFLGGRDIHLSNHDIEDWTISFVDTGTHANIGQRLLAVREYLEGEDVFMANYADGLAALALYAYLDNFYWQDKIASFLCVRPSQSFHVVNFMEDGCVSELSPVYKSDIWINGGFFVLSSRIFEYIKPGEELVEEPFARLIADKKLSAVRYTGFWRAMDTFKDKIQFDRMYARGDAPWEVWKDKSKEAADV